MSMSTHTSPNYTYVHVLVASVQNEQLKQGIHSYILGKNILEH